MENSATAAVEQSEPISQPVAQSEPAVPGSDPAPSSVASVHAVSSAPDEHAHAEAAELPQPAASAPAMSTDTIRLAAEQLTGANVRPLNPSLVITNETPVPGDPTVPAPAEDNEPHPHELERMVDEGGQCPDRFKSLDIVEDTIQNSGERRVALMADHPFVSTPTPTDPLARICSVPGCKFADFAHPATDATASPLAGDLPACSLEDRVARMEAELAGIREFHAQLRRIIRHHGLREPEGVVLLEPQA
jgi:hypothetical protein